jgi:hypothetical protein
VSRDAATPIAAMASGIVRRVGCCEQAAVPVGYADRPMDSLVGYSPIQLRVEPSLAPRLPELSQGRALVIDYYASRRCGVTIGDLNVSFGSMHPGSDYAELDSIGDVRVLAERYLLEPLRAGGELAFRGPAFAHRLALPIDRPEHWLEFRECHPGNRH